MNKINFNKVEFELCCGNSNQLPTSNLPEIVFSGKSNVGKSSLINKIFNRKSLARISSKPGKTGTINFYRSENIRFVDLPGYGYAKVSEKEKKRWAELVEKYFDSNRNIKLVVQIIDMRHPPTDDDYMMINYLCDRKFKFIIVMTKSDKLNKTNREKRLESIKSELNNIYCIPFSTIKNEGLYEIKEKINDSI